MKKLIGPIVVVSTVAWMVASTARAEEPSWYVRGDVGSSFEGEVDGSPKVAFDDSGLIAGAAVLPGVMISGNLVN